MSTSKKEKKKKIFIYIYMLEPGGLGAMRGEN
jgi:hypothetical protein